MNSEKKQNLDIENREQHNRNVSRKRISVTSGTYNLIQELISFTGETIYQTIHRSVELRLKQLKKEKLQGIKSTTVIHGDQNDT